MILGLHHAAIAVPDLERALAFYCGVLGFEILWDAELPSRWEAMSAALGVDSGCRIRMLGKGNSCIELFEYTESEAGDPLRPVNRHGITHIALATDDCEADYARLAEAGVQFNAPLFGKAPGRFAYGRDPFGNVIELLEHAPGRAGSLDFRPTRSPAAQAR